MKVCGQTLILVDNDGTVSDINQKIVKSTLKYMLYHAPDNRAFCMENYTHELEEEEVYTTEINDLLCKVDLMEFEAKDSNLNDCLAGVLTNWKKSDFACRDIVVFTDGMESAGTDYEKEELYYLIENSNYPVYVVYLVQEDNASAKKQLSAIATLSEGGLFETEYPGDDAGVDRTISEGIFAKMENYSNLNWKEYEEENTETTQVNDEINTMENADNSPISDITEEQAVKMSEQEEQAQYVRSDMHENYEVGQKTDDEIVYENVGSTDSIYSRPQTLLFGFAFLVIVIISAIVSGMVIVKKRKEKAREVLEIKSLTSKAVKKDEFFDDTAFGGIEYRDNLFDDNPYNDNPYNDDCFATRILTQNNTVLLSDNFVHEIELCDVSDSHNTMKMAFEKSTTVGRVRSDCDCVIDDDSVSKKHCVFTYEEGNYYLSDLDSSNGTFVNGEKIKKMRIDSGDNIKIGRTTYKVRCI